MENLIGELKGIVKKNFLLSPITYFKVGGRVDYFFQPKDIEDLTFFLKNKPKDMDIFILGLGSNIVVRDGGFRGVVIRLNNFTAINLQGENKIVAGAFVADKTVATFAKNNSLAGMEFLHTIPGTLGGAVFMNAGCFGKEIKDIFEYCKVVDYCGNEKKFFLDDMNFSYRYSSLFKNNYIVVEICLKGEKNIKGEIEKTILEIEKQRTASQPRGERTGGSTFANPHGMKAWELIKKVGLDKLRIGGAYIAAKHSNFIINDGTATANDIEILGETIRKKVKEQEGIDLEWEIQIIGERI